MVGAVMSEGLRGMQLARGQIEQAAGDIARAPLARNEPSGFQEQAGMPPTRATRPGLTESLIELQRQELLFTASAKVVDTAQTTLGSLLDIDA